MLKNLLMNLLRAPAHALQARREQRILPGLESAIAAFNDKKYEEVVSACVNAIAREPRSARANHLCGQALVELERYAEADSYLQAAIAAEPDLAEAHSDHAVVLFKTGDHEAAEISCRRAVALQPREIRHRLRLVEFLEVTNRIQEAVKELSIAQEYAPERPDLRAKLSYGLERLGMYKEMLQIAERVILEIGEDFDTLLALAAARYHTADIQGAVDACRKALTFSADKPEVYMILGAASFIQGKLDEAMTAYRRALKVRPEFPDALYHIGLVNLMRGKFREGWQGFEHRFELDQNKSMRPCLPRWNGTSLRGRTIQVMREQGLGDEIMYASCYPQIVKDAGRCLIECDPRLERLFVRSFPAAEFFPLSDIRTNQQTDTGVDVDVRTYAASLPRYLRNSLRDFPDHQGYLKADPDRIAHWRERLSQVGDGTKIGISWRGGTVLSHTANRSLTLGALLPVLSVPGVNWINLQYGKRADEIAEFQGANGIDIADWSEAVDGDYDETAALVSALDMVISVCTSVVHLSGALGKPVWVMAPYVPEWRYGLQGATMPWYPAARLFRQTEAGGWDPVISDVRQALRQICSTQAL